MHGCRATSNLNVKCMKCKCDDANFLQLISIDGLNKNQEKNVKYNMNPQF